MSKGIVKRINKFNQKLAEMILPVILFPKRIFSINKIINKSSFYPHIERKSRKEMWLDNFKWLIKNKELNKFYISYGLDVKDGKNPNDYLAHREFCILRDKGNQENIETPTGDYNYINLLRDKYIFSEYLSQVLGKDKVVQNIALIENGKLYNIKEKKWTNLSFIFEEKCNLVIKSVDGQCADGIYLLEKNDEKLIFNCKISTKDEICNALGKYRYVVQNIEIQHSLLRKFKTKSVNTLRVVTFRGNSGKINLFSAFLRLSSSPDSFVDNRAVGGLAVGINLESGKLNKYGIPHDQFGVLVEQHQLSGIKFENLQLPYWKETKDLVFNAHMQIPKLQTIGWDVILTDNGPILLEGNDDWEIGGPQDTAGGLKQRWYDLARS